MKKWTRVCLLLFVLMLMLVLVPKQSFAAEKKGKVKSITVTSTPANILVVKKNQKYKLKVKVTTSGKVSKKVTYKSANPKIATVSSKGRVKGIRKGTTKITVRSVANPKVKKTIKVKVGTPVKKIILQNKKVSMEKGTSYKIKAKFSPKKPTYKKLSFKSSDKTVAKVSKSGKVTALKAGKATITVRSKDGSNKKATCVITVLEDKASSVSNNTSISQNTVNPQASESPVSSAEPTASEIPDASVEPGASEMPEASADPSQAPTVAPSANPSQASTAAPSEKPSQAPTAAPSEKPSQAPTVAPSEKPSQAPSEAPTVKPSQAPTAAPSEKPSQAPTIVPSTPVDSGLTVVDGDFDMPIDAEKMFEAPYISTYYFNPKPSIHDNIQIPLYITDHEQSEYINNDTTGRLDLIYEVDGEKKRIIDLPLGDYTLNLGKLSKGMHTFAVQALDKRTGVRSHKLFNELWVVDPEEYTISEADVYYMTEQDLADYMICNENSTDANDLISTRDGLTDLFTDKQAEGYKKIVLLKGTYRVNCAVPKGNLNYKDYAISIPSHFTVDMNGSTFKLDPITDADPSLAAEIVVMDGVVDAHITNGILEGDRVEKQELGMETEEASGSGVGEHIGTIFLKGVKYCTVSNLTIQNTAGFTIYNNGEQGPSVRVNHYTKSAILDGKEVQNEKCSTSAMMDITKIANWEKNPGYIHVGHPWGYRGIQGESPIVYVSFYNANQEFIETVTGYQFRKMKVPAEAKYARVTMLGNISETDAERDIYIFAKNYGEYSAVRNVDFVDTRTCAIATACCNNFLVEECTYTRCGWSITSAEVDFEDGAQEMQDIYYRSNEVLEKAPTNTITVISCSGFNHVYENNKGHSIEIRAAVCGGVVRNTKDVKTDIVWFLGDKLNGSYGRMYNNEINSVTSRDSRKKKYTFADLVIKDCVFFGGWTEAVPDKVIFDHCTFKSLNGGYATFRDCNIQPGSVLGDKFKFYDCTFMSADNANGKVTLTFGGAVNADRVFERCKFNGKTMTDHYFKSGTFQDCEFDDLSIIAPTSMESTEEKILFEDCIIHSSANNFIEVGPWTSSEGYLNFIFTNCTITHTGNNFIGIYAKSITAGSQILFDRCKINKSVNVSLNPDVIKVIN